MLKKFLVFLLSFSFALGMSETEIKSYIEENSDNYELLKSTPSKIYASNPTLLYLLYALAPEKIIDSNFEWNDYERPYIKESVLNQPVVGGFFGQGKIPNIEMLLRINPELILINANSKNSKKMKDVFGSIKKPMLYLSATSLEDYVQSFEILGHVIGKEQRAKELTLYAQNSLNLTEKIEAYIAKNGLKKVRMYYAQGKDGLSTECEGSYHATLIPKSGGEVVHKCGEENANSYGRVKVSFEQVLKYNLDMILIYEREFYDKIYSDPKWALLDAVKNKRVYYIPREPFSWFDRPPSFMRFLGIKWLINLAYPDAFKFDMISQTKEFYKLFLDISLSDEQAIRILGKK
ncbi:ABC transporter substrate-binding protein [Campylobacter sp. RM15925]|uniref:ABC transporter substrate-binding protein n=1 Tax=Campylobacter sp. RM15925 TaxID=1705724 RepID=UPI0014764688|nr:ABC transporter substrate-binding protein [Campylobacter sp. RM15925]